LLIDFVYQNGMYYAPERIDEMTETPDISSARDPLKLNMSRLRSINSYGIRNMIKLVREWGSRTMEYHECPPVFVDRLNVVSSMLGTPPNAARVKSFAVPYYCAANDKTYDIMFNVDDLDLTADEPKLPDVKCDECEGPVEPDCSLEEYLLFLFQDD
jgi:hypothetical protein